MSTASSSVDDVVLAGNPLVAELVEQMMRERTVRLAEIRAQREELESDPAYAAKQAKLKRAFEAASVVFSGEAASATATVQETTNAKEIPQPKGQRLTEKDRNIIVGFFIMAIAINVLIIFIAGLLEQRELGGLASMQLLCLNIMCRFVGENSFMVSVETETEVKN